MKWRLVDLTLPLESAVSEPEPIAIEWIDHRQGAALLMKEAPERFPDGLGLSLERVKMTSHSGTHVDAPIHYGPLSEGQTARCIDELPLEWFFGYGLVLHCEGDFDQTVSRAEIENALKHQRLKLQKGNLVLIYTGADRLWGREEYFTSFRGISREGVLWLLNQGIKVIGVDSFGFDAPFCRMIEKFRKTGNREELWPCHMLGRDREYCQIERMTNLACLPKSKKFLMCCFPIKLKGCGAGQTRAVAFLEKEARSRKRRKL